MIEVKNLKKDFKKTVKEPGLKGSIKSLFHPKSEIVEAVNPDGTVVISEGWKIGNCESMSWSSVGYQTKTVTLDYIKYHTNRSGDQYYFNGYVYLLG